MFFFFVLSVDPIEVYHKVALCNVVVKRELSELGSITRHYLYINHLYPRFELKPQIHPLGYICGHVSLILDDNTIHCTILAIFFSIIINVIHTWPNYSFTSQI